MVRVWVVICCVLFALSMLSCNSVKKSQKGTKTEYVTRYIYDTVHKTVIDTTKSVLELQEYQNKIVEIYDTNIVDVPVLRQRIIWQNVYQTKETINKGVSTDSASSHTKQDINVKQEVKESEKKSSRLPIVGIVIIIILIIIGYGISKFYRFP